MANQIVYDKTNFEKVAEVITNHSISIEDALRLIGAEYVEIENPWDADLIIDGKKYWSDDLEMELEDDYNVRKKFQALLDKCVTKNGSGHKCFSLAMLDDREIKWMAEECLSWDWLDVTDDGGNNLYKVAEEKGFI